MQKIQKNSKNILNFVFNRAIIIMR